MNTEELSFSIIVPTYSRARQLGDCLEALSQLEYRRNLFEVIVVDDGGETPPEGVVARFRERPDVVLHTQPHAGPAAARNTGAARASGQFLAFTDDDCTPAPDWLRSLSKRFAREPDRAIGGRTLNALLDDPFSTASQVIIDIVYDGHNADPNGARFFASNNLAMAKEGFQAIGGFDTTFPMAAGEDRDLCDRWLHHGYRLTYAPEVVVYHRHALTLRSFWRQHFNYGRGAFCLYRARARRGTGRLKPKPSFYIRLLQYPFVSSASKQSRMLVVLLLVSQVAVALGVSLEAEKQLNPLRRVKLAHRSS